MLTRRWISRTAVVSALALLVVVAIEAWGRYNWHAMPVQWQIIRLAVGYPFIVVPDPELGFTMPPNQREVIRTRDSTFVSETDAKGYPNRNPWPDNPSVVFLGDSFITGGGVGLDANFVAHLQRMFPDRSWLNLGLAGAGPERQARIYSRFGSQWRPDLVVSCIVASFDFENDAHFVSWLRDGHGSDYNAYRLVLARADRNRGLLQRFLDNSLVLDRTIEPILRKIGRSPPVEKRYRFPDGSETLFERHALAFATAAVSDDDPRLSTMLESLMRLRTLVEQSGARFLVMLIPTKEELFALEPERTEQNLASRLKERLAGSAAVLDLSSAVRRGGTAQSPYFTWDAHLNAYGNRIVAEEFAAWFTQR